jgi:hypothetical protein
MAQRHAYSGQRHAYDGPDACVFRTEAPTRARPLPLPLPVWHRSPVAAGAPCAPSVGCIGAVVVAAWAAGTEAPPRASTGPAMNHVPVTTPLRASFRERAHNALTHGCWHGGTVMDTTQQRANIESSNSFFFFIPQYIYFKYHSLRVIFALVGSMVVRV